LWQETRLSSSVSVVGTPWLIAHHSAFRRLARSERHRDGSSAAFGVFVEECQWVNSKSSDPPGFWMTGCSPKPMHLAMHLSPCSNGTRVMGVLATAILERFTLHRLAWARR
jgi:hypothetical protein